MPHEIVCIIDRSGSMGIIQDDAIGGFNTFLAAQKRDNSDAHLSLVLFDHEYQLVADGAPIHSVEPLSPTTYVPRGMTALFDAVGRAVQSVRARRRASAEGDTGQVVVCILTDGEENASSEYSQPHIAKLIADTRAEDGWSFVFLAANQDAFRTASDLAIPKATTAAFAATGAGIRQAYDGMSTIVTSITNVGGTGTGSKGGSGTILH